MIDFKNAAFFKLRPASDRDYFDKISPMFIDGETIIQSFRGLRDGVVFTNKRIISINIKGPTGCKRDYTSVPYSKIQAYSVETAGILDLDSELILWISGLGQIKFEFVGKADIANICKIISLHVL